MKSNIINLAKENHIDEIRFIDAENLKEDHIGDLQKFQGRQPLDIMPDAKTVIVFSTYIGRFVTDTSHHFGRTSRLVLSGYYANIVKPLKPIKEYLESLGHKAMIIDGESDDASIPLKGTAVKAGLGWIGKNSLLINDKYGSFQALGAILTDADISETYPIMKNKCGECFKCSDACPSNAIRTPHILDRPNCLSNFLEDDNPETDISNGVDLNGYFFECDICQNVCPWNQQHIKCPLDTPYGRLFDSNKLDPIMELDHLRDMDEDDYEREIAPLMIGYKLPYKTFKRNIEILLRGE
ncbi:MAG: epoxyqueuosine reductase [Clostridiales bacterium]|nr:epoxyqueuosine reductase [Clostridiales bacterium]